MSAHVSIDLETAGKGINAAIMSIGACKFIPSNGEIGQRFHRNIELGSAVAAGGEIDASTFKWWLEQSSEARVALLNDSDRTLLEVLDEFDAFLAGCAEDGEELYLWGNGIGSDNTWLRATYARIGREMPVPFWGDADVRTAVLIGRTLGFDPKRTRPFEGSPHNPVDDATHQARYVSDILQHLSELKTAKTRYDSFGEQVRVSEVKREDVISMAGVFLVVTGLSFANGRYTITLSSVNDPDRTTVAEFTVKEDMNIRRLK